MALYDVASNSCEAPYPTVVAASHSCIATAAESGLLRSMTGTV